MFVGWDWASETHDITVIGDTGEGIDRWSWPAARLPRRTPQTASVALMPAWIAKLVAAIPRSASSSFSAAARYSSALAR